MSTAKEFVDSPLSGRVCFIQNELKVRTNQSQLFDAIEVDEDRWIHRWGLTKLGRRRCGQGRSTSHSGFWFRGGWANMGIILELWATVVHRLEFAKLAYCI